MCKKTKHHYIYNLIKFKCYSSTWEIFLDNWGTIEKTGSITFKMKFKMFNINCILSPLKVLIM